MLLFGLAASYPQYGYGAYGGVGAGGQFGEQGFGGGAVDLAGQGQFSDSNYGPLGGGQQQGEFSGNLQAQDFNSQSAGGFGGVGGVGGFGQVV